MAGLLERTRELAAIDELIAAVRSGAGGLAVVEGPAGIGKTALLVGARQRARDAGLRVLAARGSELERAFAFGAVRQLFEPLVAAADGRERARLFVGAAARLETVVRGEVVPGTGEQGLFGVLHGLYWLTANASERSPLLLCVDDMHWVDESSLRFLAYVARRIEDLPVGIVGAARIGEPAVPETLLDELRLESRAQRLDPTPLGPASVGQLVRAELPAADDALCAACHLASAGNPFYLRELLRALAMEGAGEDPDVARKVGEISISSVGERVVRRITRLGDDALALGRAMAALGDGGRLAEAAPLAGLGDAEASLAAAGLVKVEVLAREDPFSFVHPLVRRSVHAQLSLAERDEAHAAAAGLLGKRGAPLDEVAAHLLLTRPAGSQSVVQTLRTAAAQVLLRGAPESARAYLQRALAEPPVEGERVGVLRELAAAEALTADAAAVDHLAEAHAATEEPRERAQVALEYGRAWVTLFDLDRAAGVFATALAELGEREPLLADQLRAELYSLKMIDLDSVATIVPELLALPDEPLPGPAGGTLSAIKACVALYLNAPAARCSTLARGALADGRGASASWNGSRMALSVLINAEDFDAAGEFLGQALDEARARGDANMLSGTYMFLAWRAQALGALADAEAYSDQQMAIVRLGAPSRLAFGSSTRASLYLDRGQVSDAARTVAETGELAEAPPDAWPATGAFMGLLCTRGRVRLAHGRMRDAVEDLERVLRAEPPDSGLRLPSSIECRPSAAVGLLALGKPERARKLAHDELERARAFGAPRMLGGALRIAGIVERDLALLEESVVTLERSPARLERARSLVELGAALRRANQRAAGRERLRAGMELAHRCGATPVVERALEELRAAGARPRRILRSGVASLTASELRVARLAAEGRTNPEIAQELYISLKTVEMHLSRAYGKLDLSGKAARRRLAQVLAQEPSIEG